MSKTFTSKPGIGGFIVSEANGGSTGQSRSRDNIILAATTTAIATGTIIARLADRTYVPFDPAASDGSEVPYGFLFGYANISTETQRAVGIVRDAEVNAEEIVWPAGIDAAGILAASDALEARGLLIREADVVSVDSADDIAYDNPSGL